MITSKTLTFVPQLERGVTYQMGIPKGSILGESGAVFDGLAEFTVVVIGTCSFRK